DQKKPSITQQVPPSSKVGLPGAILSTQISRATTHKFVWLRRLDLNQRANLVYLGGVEKCGEEKTKLVPGARHGPNVCRFVSSGWPRHESEANLDWISGRFADAQPWAGVESCG